MIQLKLVYKNLNWIIGVFMLVVFCACKSDNNDVIVKPQTITEIVYNSRNTSVFKAAVNKANLSSVLQGNNITIFIPTDVAFANSNIVESTINAMSVADVETLVKYHIINTQTYSTTNYPTTTTAVNSLATLNGSLYLKKDTSGLFVNGNRITQSNILAQNGVAHVLDYVLGAPITPVGAPTKTILNIVSTDSTLSLLNMLINKTAATINDIKALLETVTNSTLFAPTNIAFTIAGYDSTAIANATAATVNALANVIKYHITNGKFFANDISNNQQLTTLNNMAAMQPIVTGVNPIVIKGATNTEINSAKLELGNLLGTNGIVHKIDKLILP
jgi:uncharacterized surface protein with fasciclin (FAS1) repeats